MVVKLFGHSSDRYSFLEKPRGKLVGCRDVRCNKQYGLLVLFASCAVLEACCEKMRDLRKEVMHVLLTHSVCLV